MAVSFGVPGGPELCDRNLMRELYGVARRSKGRRNRFRQLGQRLLGWLRL